MSALLEDLDALKKRLDELEQTVRHMKASAKGDPGRDGKDGRDGRDGKSLNSARVISALRSASAISVRGAEPIISFDPRITIQPAEVKAPDVHVAAPTVQVAAPEVHVSPQILANVRQGRTVTRHTRDERGEIIESIAEHES